MPTRTLDVEYARRIANKMLDVAHSEGLSSIEALSVFGMIEISIYRKLLEKNSKSDIIGLVNRNAKIITDILNR